MGAYSFATDLTSVGTVDTAQTSTTLTLSSESDFEIQAICGKAVQSNLLVSNWAGKVQIQEEASGKTLFNKPILFDTIAGDGRTPFLLPTPIRVAAKSSLIVTFTQAGTTATSVQLVFHGVKV